MVGSMGRLDPYETDWDGRQVHGEERRGRENRDLACDEPLVPDEEAFVV